MIILTRYHNPSINLSMQDLLWRMLLAVCSLKWSLKSQIFWFEQASLPSKCKWSISVSVNLFRILLSYKPDCSTCNIRISRTNCASDTLFLTDNWFSLQAKFGLILYVLIVLRILLDLDGILILLLVLGTGVFSKVML